ncbi:hypothetical protein IWX90DRAFT_43743 [Phyllosticta citrichinensis]|uniref:Uncharacterized protein n=1 Tax=Phyllosticta citrichinensis TaxID=1130410 RepID=A0ABR1Y954_9PEZI
MTSRIVAKVLTHLEALRPLPLPLRLRALHPHRHRPFAPPIRFRVHQDWPLPCLTEGRDSCRRPGRRRAQAHPGHGDGFAACCLGCLADGVMPWCCRFVLARRLVQSPAKRRPLQLPVSTRHVASSKKNHHQILLESPAPNAKAIRSDLRLADSTASLPGHIHGLHRQDELKQIYPSSASDMAPCYSIHRCRILVASFFSPTSTLSVALPLKTSKQVIMSVIALQGAMHMTKICAKLGPLHPALRLLTIAFQLLGTPCLIHPRPCSC